MTEKTNPCHCVQNVGCNVADCKYHAEGNVCHAQKITVSNPAAQCKADTFCSTFENRTK